ncbi:hypothetical protein C8J57DRAFT_1517692 [Mycena rebaudengoi]|nr:hypothetical protein C8J57DRAFT_1517692 [Mycena rebaudengoi]
MSTSTPPYAPPAIRAITAPLVTRAAPPIPCAEALTPLCVPVDAAPRPALPRRHKTVLTT